MSNSLKQHGNKGGEICICFIQKDTVLPLVVFLSVISLCLSTGTKRLCLTLLRLHDGINPGGSLCAGILCPQIHDELSSYSLKVTFTLTEALQKGFCSTDVKLGITQPGPGHVSGVETT